VKHVKTIISPSVPSDLQPVCPSQPKRNVCLTLTLTLWTAGPDQTRLEQKAGAEARADARAEARAEAGAEARAEAGAKARAEA
jgi:hypothetical protein